MECMETECYFGEDTSQAFEAVVAEVTRPIRQILEGACVAAEKSREGEKSVLSILG